MSVQECGDEGHGARIPGKAKFKNAARKCHAHCEAGSERAKQMSTQGWRPLSGGIQAET
jgi:hypothetical protein